jgi:putative membrane protein
MRSKRNGKVRRTRKRILSFIAVLAAALPATSRAVDSSSNPLPPSAQVQSPSDAGSASSRAASGLDLTFLNDAAPGGMLEVELGQLALKQASSPKVKQFAQRMIDDHAKANAELQALAAKKRLSLKTEKSATQKQAIAKLAKLKGRTFDREYANLMVTDHEEDIAKFQGAANASDADVKAFAAKTLPTLQEHLEMARKLADEVGASKA